MALVERTTICATNLDHVHDVLESRTFSRDVDRNCVSMAKISATCRLSFGEWLKVPVPNKRRPQTKTTIDFSQDNSYLQERAGSRKISTCQVLDGESRSWAAPGGRLISLEEPETGQVQFFPRGFGHPVLSWTGECRKGIALPPPEYVAEMLQGTSPVSNALCCCEHLWLPCPQARLFILPHRGEPTTGRVHSW